MAALEASFEKLGLSKSQISNLALTGALTRQRQENAAGTMTLTPANGAYSTCFDDPENSRELICEWDFGRFPRKGKLMFGKSLLARFAVAFFALVFAAAIITTFLVGLISPDEHPPLNWSHVTLALTFAAFATGGLLVIALLAMWIDREKSRRFYRKHLAKYTESERREAYRRQLRHLGLHKKGDDDS